MEFIGWVDLEPIMMTPTLTNNHGVTYGFSKWLDRFLVHQDILQHLEIF